MFVGSDYYMQNVSAYCGNTYRYYFEEIEVDVGKKHTSLVFTGRKQRIQLGWSPQIQIAISYTIKCVLQEVISEIGAPVSVFRRAEDPNDGATVAGGLVSDYFHNYPHLGLDILYDSMHRASKVILKTNALGHPDFGAYNKCNFQLNFQSAEMPTKISSKITPETPDIRLVFGRVSDLRPIVHDNGLGLHPFGSSLCYSPTPGCIFEVMKNGFIASVTLTSSS
ncbi:hypothetical protein DD237_001852 [Peronospora effusa]|uniref:Uncharacterized protein n=1 Tax=Peronospora effusa TaxID=542832 RepID=A0A3R7WBF9_9STRA|nr:hypothetical protein DD237_001852 [Peronospora effusa]